MKYYYFGANFVQNQENFLGIHQIRTKILESIQFVLTVENVVRPLSSPYLLSIVRDVPRFGVSGAGWRHVEGGGGFPGRWPIVNWIFLEILRISKTENQKNNMVGRKTELFSSFWLFLNSWGFSVMILNLSSSVLKPTEKKKNNVWKIMKNYEKTREHGVLYFINL